MFAFDTARARSWVTPAALASAACATLAGVVAGPRTVLGQTRPAVGAGARAIEGDVVQAESGAALPGATVVLAPASTGALAADPARDGAEVVAARRVVTGADGRYHFGAVPAGAYVLQVYRLGFRPATVEVELRDGGPGVRPAADRDVGAGAAAARVSVGLTVVPIRLHPVAVEAAAPEPFARHARGAHAVADARAAALRVRQARFLATDAREVTHADVEDAVTLGETDLFRALQRLPGVATQGDASAQLWTRGARWDQTRVTFDGLPLFNPLHTGGLLSAVNSDAVGAAFLLPGVRPAATGEGSAAVLDLRSRAGGGTGALRGLGELSLLSGRVALDQSVAGGRGAWMVAGRRSYLDLIVNRVARDSTGDPFPYHLGEVTARADWRFASGRTLEVSGLHSRDRLGDPATYTNVQQHPAGWENSAARATLSGPARLGPFGPGTLRTTFGVSTYVADLDFMLLNPSGDPIPNGRRPVRERLAYATLAGDFTPRTTDPESSVSGAGPRWTGGYALTTQRAAAEGSLGTVYTIDTSDSTVASRRGTLPMLALWGERRFAPAPDVTVAAGLRIEAGTRVRNDGPLRPAPRVAARYRPGGGNTVVSAGLGRHFQYLQGLPEPSENTGSPESAVIRILRPRPCNFAPVTADDVTRLFAAHHAAHHAALFRYLARLTGDPDRAADAAQEAFVRLIDRAPALAEDAGGGHARAWLFTVATNVVREGGRTHARRARLLAAGAGRAPLADPPPDAHARVEADARRQVVAGALADLSEKERVALLMREEGFAHREIAAAVGTTTGSVGTLLARALDKLARALPLDAGAL